jgi:hypothetical protein
MFNFIVYFLLEFYTNIIGKPYNFIANMAWANSLNQLIVSSFFFCGNNFGKNNESIY